MMWCTRTENSTDIYPIVTFNDEEEEEGEEVDVDDEEATHPQENLNKSHTTYLEHRYNSDTRGTVSRRWCDRVESERRR